MTDRPTTEPPHFTPTQRAWLREMLRPGCCHTSGEHDPTHFRQDKHVCLYQRVDRYNALRTALDLGNVQPHEARSTPGCVWCEEHGLRPERLRKEPTPAQSSAPTAKPDRNQPEPIDTGNNRLNQTLDELRDWANGDDGATSRMQLAATIHRVLTAAGRR